MEEALPLVTRESAVNLQVNTTPYKVIIKNFIWLMAPITITEVLESSRDFVNGIYLADLSEEAFAASTFITTITDFCTQAMPAFIYCLPTILVRHTASGQPQLVGAYYRQAQFLVLVASVPIVIVYLNAEHLLLALGQDKKITSYVQDYFNIASVGAPFYMSIISARHLAFSINEKRLALIAGALDVTIYLGFGYLLTFGPGDAPELGIRGLGWAELMRAFSIFIMYEAMFICTGIGSKYGLYQFSIKQHFKKVIEILKLGYPLVIQIGAELSAYFLLANMVGWLGKDDLVAYQMPANYLLFTAIPTLGITQAVAIKVSEAVAEGSLENVKRYANTAMLLTFGIDVFFFLMFAVSNKYLMRAYIDIDAPENQAIVEATEHLFRIRYAGQIFSGLKHVCTGNLRGMKYTFWAMVLNTFALWAGGIGLGYLFGIKLFNSVVAMMGGYNIGMAAGCIGMMAMWYKKSQVLPDENTADQSNMLSVAGLFGRCWRNQDEDINEQQPLVEAEAENATQWGRPCCIL